MKKFYLVLIIFSLFVFVSCGGSKNNSENPDEDGITDEDEYEVDADSTDTDDSTDTASDDDAADTGDTEPENAGVVIYLGILGFN